MKTNLTFFCILLPYFLFSQELADTSKLSELISKAESFDIVKENDSALYYYDKAFIIPNGLHCRSDSQH